MKRVINFILMIGLTSLSVSCLDEIKDGTNGETAGASFVISDFKTEEATKSAFQTSSMKFQWSSDDTLGIFPSTGYQAVFPMEKGAGSNVAVFDGGGWGLRADASYCAYYPFSRDNFESESKRSRVGYSYEGQKACAADSEGMVDLSGYDFMASGPSTLENGCVTFNFKHLGALCRINFAAPATRKYSKIMIETDDNVFATEGYFNATAKSDDIKLIASSEKTNRFIVDFPDDNQVINENETVEFYFLMPPVDLSGKQIRISITDNEGHAYGTEAEGKNIQAGMTYGWEIGDIKEDGVGDFSLDLIKVEADKVEFYVTAPYEVELAYQLYETQKTVLPAVLFYAGEKVTVSPADTLKITKGLTQNTEYYLYLAAKIDTQNYSDVFEFNFTTESYDFEDLLTVVDRYYDGFKVHINVPESTVASGNVIRYSTASLALYNVLKSQYGGDEDYLNVVATVANGNPFGNYVTDDETLVYDNSNTILTDENGDPVLDENGQMIEIHDPISPGEPSVFMAGEYRWGSNDEMCDIVGFMFGFEENAYIVPTYQPGAGWTGAFQKLEFFAKEPTRCEATVHIDIPEEEISPVDAVINFTMDEGVYRYFYMVVDEQTYNSILSIYLDGHEEWFQWFLTSYIAFHDFDIHAYTENITVHAGHSFNEGLLIGGERYHVLCTVMGDNEGTTQNFVHKTFRAKEKTMKAPVIEVTAVDSGDPYTARFNIKAPDKDVMGAYFAANYAREWKMMLNGGYTYEDILKENYTLGAYEIRQINSDKGLNLMFDMLDGETMRLAVYGANEEYTFNYINPDQEGAGWADYHAPMADKVSRIESNLYSVLPGDWTATAQIMVNEMLEDGSTVQRALEYSSKVNITNEIMMPDHLTSTDYELYENFGVSRNEVEAMYNDLRHYADMFTEYRLEGQNRMLCEGFIDFDYYENSSMAYKSPYDLFTSTDYSSVDIPQIIYDFGPKWFLEVQHDGSVIVPFNSMTLPPMHAWPSYPSYVGGIGNGGAFFDNNDQIKGFPVEISEDYSRITIKPIVLDGVNYYMNAVFVTDRYDLESIATVTSDIVLTRGWTETRSAKKSVPAKAKAEKVSGSKTIPQKHIYKSLSDFSKVKPAVKYKVEENPCIVTMDMVNATTDKILKHYNLK